MSFPMISYGLPKPTNKTEQICCDINSKDVEKICGTPVYPGEVTARACVITDIEDANTIQAGLYLFFIHS